MKSMVVGVWVLASALVRERGDAIRDRLAWEEQPSAVVLPRVVEDDLGGDLARALAPEIGDGELSTESTVAGADEPSDATSPRGQWEIACEIKSGSALVFDRASLRDYGPVTLFRWSAPRARIAAPGEQIFTAVVNCREKTIEAAWPGRSRETYAGTCGRGLVEAVCTAAEQASATGRAQTPAPSRANQRSPGEPPRP
jgi:hypothetical protein